MRERSGPIDASGRWIRTGGRIVVLADETAPGAGAIAQEVNATRAPSPRDVVDTRIDPCAQFSLLRLGKVDPAGRAAALGLLAGVQSGQLAGIYGENLKASARLAATLGTVWWKLIPPGEDAAVVVDPNAPTSAPATIVFRSTQTSTAKPGTPQACLAGVRLDAALRRAWTSLQLLQAGKLVRCDLLPASVSAEHEAFGSTAVANIVPPLCARGEFTNVASITDAERWTDLISFRPPPFVRTGLRQRDFALQLIETGSGNVNLDNYSIRVTKLPMLGGSRATPEQLLGYIRLHLNDFAATSSVFDTKFMPYDATIDTPVWVSANALGAIIDIDIPGPDNGAVVVSEHAFNHWIFTTVTAPTIWGPGLHPVSGNRMFGFRQTADNLVFFIRGADRVSSPYMPEDRSFDAGHELWSTVQRNIASFINAHGGSAATALPERQRHNWLAVRVLYFKPQMKA